MTVNIIFKKKLKVFFLIYTIYIIKEHESTIVVFHHPA